MPPAADAPFSPHLELLPLFASITERDRTLLARTGVARRYAPGEPAVVRGENGVGLYVVLEGRFEVRSEGVVRATLEPGAFFGEMALFEDQPRPFDVVAVVPSRCFVLSRWEFWAELAREPELLRDLMTAAVHRLRSTPHALTE